SDQAFGFEDSSLICTCGTRRFLFGPRPGSAERNPECAMESFGPPIETRVASELTLDARRDHLDPVALPSRWPHRRSQAFRPGDDQGGVLELPCQPDAARGR